jgi:hypothetical protein
LIEAFLPANALAGHDEIRGAWRIGVAAVKSEGGDDYDQQGCDRDQINLARIVTAVTLISITSMSTTLIFMTVILVADFPAH